MCVGVVSLVLLRPEFMLAAVLASAAIAWTTAPAQPRRAAAPSIDVRMEAAAASSYDRVSDAPVEHLQRYLQLRTVLSGEPLPDEAVEALISRIEDEHPPAPVDEGRLWGEWQLVWQKNAKQATRSQKALAPLPQYSNFQMAEYGKSGKYGGYRTKIFRNIVRLTRNRVQVVADVAYTLPASSSAVVDADDGSATPVNRLGSSICTPSPPYIRARPQTTSAAAKPLCAGMRAQETLASSSLTVRLVWTAPRHALSLCSLFAGRASVELQIGRRFRWRPLRIPLPLKGEGFLDVVFLSKDMRITRGSRGGCFVHLRPELISREAAQVTGA